MKELIMNYKFIISTVLILLVIIFGCSKPVVNKLAINKDVNLFPPKYHGYEKTEYDCIDFRKPHEKGTRTYRLLSDPDGDIDRTLGYDPAEYTVTPDFSLISNPEHDIQITWINHASFLIQFGGRYQILTDPVLAPVDGLAGWLMGFFDTFELQAQPPIKIKDLPFTNDKTKNTGDKINIVAISHDHYDHLNWNTIKQLPSDVRYFVPINIHEDFPSRYSKVTGMTWYGKDVLEDLTVHFLPANHRSGRGLITITPSLWGGWLFEYKNTKVYFAGDTGYSDLFKDIRKRYGIIDICLMSISAWFQRDLHFAPEDAICAAQDLGCRILIPWGWGTWIMSYEHILEPPRRLQYAWDQMKPENMELKIMKMGEIFSFDINSVTGDTQN
jgi:N-acyl-phosphatidylethanolamine-hydrolysing phospholipase D